MFGVGGGLTDKSLVEQGRQRPKPSMVTRSCLKSRKGGEWFRRARQLAHPIQGQFGNADLHGYGIQATRCFVKWWELALCCAATPGSTHNHCTGNGVPIATEQNTCLCGKVRPSKCVCGSLIPCKLDQLSTGGHCRDTAASKKGQHCAIHGLVAARPVARGMVMGKTLLAQTPARKRAHNQRTACCMHGGLHSIAMVLLHTERECNGLSKLAAHVCVT